MLCFRLRNNILVSCVFSKDAIVYVYRLDIMMWKNTIYVQNSQGVNVQPMFCKLCKHSLYIKPTTVFLNELATTNELQTMPFTTHAERSRD